MGVSKVITTGIKDDQTRKPGKLFLRTPGLLAKWPIIGIIMFIFGSLIFAGLTYNLFAQGPFLKWDKVLANTLPAIGLKSPAFVKDIMGAGFYMGKEVIMVIAVLLAFYFIYKRYWQELAMVTIGWTGSALLFYTFSTLIDRQRPPTQIWIMVNIPGFPSGHAIAVVTFYGLIAYLFALKPRPLFGKLLW